MPELPEVETIRCDLKAQIINKKIKEVKVKKSRLVRNSVSFFVKVLKGNAFIDIDRVGKLMIFKLRTGQYMLVHLKMTGQLIYQDKKQKIAGGHSYKSDEMKYPNKYTYIIFEFADGSFLYFNDMRTFGYMQIVNVSDFRQIKNSYGIEPIDPKIKLEDWQTVFKGRKTTVKALLLNQKLIAGIGNIYADEICFASHVRPDRRVSSLTSEEIKSLFQNSQKILRWAIKKRGTTFNNYVDSQGRKGSFMKNLKVYGRAGQLCLRCKQGNIQRLKVAGRGTNFCPFCQK